jgi:hypothetical protein
MGLAETCRAVDEQRVVGLRGRFRDGECGGVREPVRRADHEEVERVLRVQPGFADPLSGRLGCVRHRAGLGNGELDPALLAGGVTNRRANQLEEMPLDPLPSEVVRHGEDE